MCLVFCLQPLTFFYVRLKHIRFITISFNFCFVLFVMTNNYSLSRTILTFLLCPTTTTLSRYRTSTNVLIVFMTLFYCSLVCKYSTVPLKGQHHINVFYIGNLL